MASRLAPCPSCTRHYKVGSSACPFCQAEVPASVPPRGVQITPVTRAALMFAGVSLAAACGGETTGSLETDGGAMHSDAAPARGPTPKVDARDAGAAGPDSAVVPVEDAAPLKIFATEAGSPRPGDDASGILPGSEDASPGGPHCGPGPAAYGVFAFPDACP
jgi:hypothetical protein